MITTWVTWGNTRLRNITSSTSERPSSNLRHPRQLHKIFTSQRIRKRRIGRSKKRLWKLKIQKHNNWKLRMRGQLKDSPTRHESEETLMKVSSRKRKKLRRMISNKSKTVMQRRSARRKTRRKKSWPTRSLPTMMSVIWSTTSLVANARISL